VRYIYEHPVLHLLHLRVNLMVKRVYDFTEGNKDMKDLLGGKGANLAEMVNMGLRVPPGFTITTKACAEFFSAKGNFPDGLWEEAGTP
jgi:pyruvate,orthophosphate dikinase